MHRPRLDHSAQVSYQSTRNSLILVHSISSSICDELVQLRPMQAEHMAVHSSPAFLHEHLLPHPVLHPHDTMHNIDFDATGLSLNVGINTPSLNSHPHCVGTKEWPRLFSYFSLLLSKIYVASRLTFLRPSSLCTVSI